MPINWGIIGIGKQAEIFMVPALNNATNTKLAAVCSRSMEKAVSFADKYGIERAYDSYEKMLNDRELDVIYVATPNSLHAQNTIQAAEAKKHVLCDKPMALTETDCERMIESCERNNVKLGVVFQNRYHPAHVEARRLIRDGEVGEIAVTKAQYCHGFMSVSPKGWRADLSMAGAGALVGAGVHPIDLLRFLFDSEVEEVLARCEPQNAHDDMDYIILKFENGVCGVVISGIQAPRSDNDVVLYGTKAKITCKGTVGTIAQGELLIEGDSINVRSNYSTGEPRSANYTRLINAFNRCITEGTDLDISGYNGLKMVRVTNAILESSRKGRAIKIH